MKELCKALIRKICAFAFLTGIVIIHPHTLFFVCPGGLGDTIILASLISTYKEKYSVEKVVLITKSKTHNNLVKKFESVDGTILLRTRFIYWVAQYVKKRDRAYKLKVRYGHFSTNDFNVIKMYNFWDSYRKLVLNIPPDKTHSGFVFCDNGAKETSKYNKCILLAPYCNSTKRLDISFWDELAKKIKLSGYYVYTNVDNNNPNVIDGTEKYDKRLDLALNEINSFSLIISSRSGFSDVVSFLNVKQIVIYNNLEQYEIYKIETDVHSDLVELVYDKDDIISNIINQI